MVATYVGQHVHAIAPSRFGYFRSDLPRDATPALQGDAFAILLDHLGIDEAVIVGYSAGGTSAFAFALRNPERTSALVLASSALPPPTADPSTLSDPPRILRPLMSSLTRTDLPMWLVARLMPSTMHRLMGIPHRGRYDRRGRRLDLPRPRTPRRLRLRHVRRQPLRPKHQTRAPHRPDAAGSRRGRQPGPLCQRRSRRRTHPGTSSSFPSPGEATCSSAKRPASVARSTLSSGALPHRHELLRLNGLRCGELIACDVTDVGSHSWHPHPGAAHHQR